MYCFIWVIFVIIMILILKFYFCFYYLKGNIGLKLIVNNWFVLEKIVILYYFVCGNKLFLL